MKKVFDNKTLFNNKLGLKTNSGEVIRKGAMYCTHIL